MIFAADVLAGIVIVVSALLMLVALVAYRRYRIPAAGISILIFLMFLTKAAVYEVNIYMDWGMDIVPIFLLADVVILISLYFTLALRADNR